MPSSPQQLEANRRNASLSTGPRSPEGKHTSARNSLKHGIRSADVVVAGHGDETQEDFDELLDRLHDELAPVGFVEQMLVSQIAAQTWRLRRVFRAESGEIATARADALYDGDLSAEADHIFAGIAAAGDLGIYDNPVNAPRRRRLNRNPKALEQMLELLRAARAQLADTGQLGDDFQRPLRLLFGPVSQIGCLLPEPINPDSPQPPAPLDSLLAAIDAQIGLTTRRLQTALPRVPADRAVLLAKNSLPPPEAADKILRYEKTIQNQLFRSMAELRRLQVERSPATADMAG